MSCQYFEKPSRYWVKNEIANNFAWICELMFRVIREWMKAIIHVMATKGSEWTEEHPHGSYAPVRQNTVTQW